MRRLCLMFLVALVLAAACGVSQATTYYVSTSGSDGWPGTESQPWLTLQHAVDSIAAGDTIIVENGTYAGCRINANSGSSGSPKTLKARNYIGAVLNQKGSSCTHNSVLEIENSSYWVIENFRVNGMSSYNYGIDVRVCDHITVRSNDTHSTAWTGIMTAFSYYSLVEDNESHECGEHGFYMANSADYGTLRNNYSWSNTRCGFHHNGDVSLGGDGQMSYWLSEKNIATGNPGAAFNYDGMNDSKMLNNLAYKNSHLGFALYGGDAAEGSRRNLVYNNTVYFTTAGYDCVQIADYGSPAIDNKIKNNILIQERTAYSSISGYSTNMGSGFESDYNVVVDRFSVDTGDHVISLATWRTYGWDTHSQISNASTEFVDAPNNDYHLKTGAKAIDGGTTLSEVTDDMDGVSRPRGSAYDCGCYEADGSIPDLVITTTGLPGGIIGVAYSQTVTATGGVTPYSWSVISGSLPSGLSLGSSTGTISGTPTASGTSNFTVRVTDSQSTPDTDDQALSIVIIDASASTYEFSSNDTEASTTSTSWQTRATLAFTPGSADDWVILAFAEYKSSSTSYSAKLRLTVDGTAEAEIIKEPKDTTDYVAFQAAKLKNLAASSHTLTLDYCSENSGATVYIRRARIVALRKSGLSIYSAAADSQQALTTTLTDYASVTLNPATGNDYLFIYSAEISANTSYSTQVQAKYDGSLHDDCLVESQDNTDFVSWMNFAMFYADSSGQTAKITAAKESGSSASHYIRRARIIALQLTGGRFNNYSGKASDSLSTTTSTSFVEKMSCTWTGGSNGNWLLIATGRISGSSTSYSTEVLLQFNDSTTLVQQLAEPKDTTDFMHYGCVDVRSITTPRDVDTDYRTEKSTATAGIRYARFYCLPLDD